MKKVNLIILAFVANYLLAAPVASGQGGNPPASTKESGATSGKGMTAVEQTGTAKGGNVGQQITALSDQAVQALLKGDTSFFEKYYADDAMVIRGFGTVYTKTQDIKNLKSGALKFETYHMRDRKIHAYGDTAIESFEASAKLVSEGKPVSGDYRVSWVWVKQNGDWKLGLYQVTPASQ